MDEALRARLFCLKENPQKTVRYRRRRYLGNEIIGIALKAILTATLSFPLQQRDDGRQRILFRDKACMHASWVS